MGTFPHSTAAFWESLGGLTSHLAGLQGTRRKWGHRPRAF